MALAQIYEAVAGHIITAARWNNEFGNIYSNGTDVAFPLTKAVSLAGFTLTLDVAGVTTLTSPASTGFLFTVGAKTGTPGVNGGLGTVTASTYTDNATAAAGTAPLWTGFSIRTPTLAATNAVTTTEAATLYVEGAPTTGTNETITNKYAITSGGDLHISVSDARTDSVDAPVTITSVTSDTPAAGIGTGVLFQAESQDENPSDVGQAEFAFSDRATASEDSYFQVLLRVAGAALTACWRWAATGAFKGIFTHANTADRTYTFPNSNMLVGGSSITMGPVSTGALSTITHEGDTTISASQALNGLHFYTNFTLDAGDTLTVSDGSHRLIIVASQSITINGTIDAIGAGGTGGSAGTAGGGNGGTGGVGFAQPGGGGGGGEGAATGGAGGGHSFTVSGGAAGSAGPNGNGGAGSSVSGVHLFLVHPFAIKGGGGGGGGGAGVPAGGAGGNGGGSIVLIAPSVTLGSASALSTNGANGGGGQTNAGDDAGSGGGGGAGNIYISCYSYTDNGCTFTLAGGSAGAEGGAAGAGGAGADGVRQINIYA